MILAAAAVLLAPAFASAAIETTVDFGGSDPSKEVVTLDLDKLRQDIAEGEVSLEFFGTTYRLVLEAVGADDVHLGSAGENVAAGWGKVRKSLLGEVDENSHVMLHVSSDGVTGFIMIGDDLIALEPYVLHDPGAAAEATVAHRKDLSEFTLEESNGGGDNELSASHTEEILLVVFFDQEMQNAHGLTPTHARARDVVRNLNNWFTQFPFIDVKFTLHLSQAYSCASWAECSHTNVDNLLAAWGGRAHTWCQERPGCKDDQTVMFHLMSGKQLGPGAAYGAGNLPGRYSVGMGVDDTRGNYRGKSDLHSHVRLVAHEIGHNFKGTHEQGQTTITKSNPECNLTIGNDYGCIWWHTSREPADWHRCNNNLIPPILLRVGGGTYGYCHTWTEGTITEHTIMKSPSRHAPEDEEYQLKDFSSASRTTIHNCIRAAPKWSAMPLTPGDHTC